MRAHYPRTMPFVVALPLLAAIAMANDTGQAKRSVDATSPVKRIHLRYLKPSECLGLLTGQKFNSRADGSALFPAGVDHIDTDDISGIIAIGGTDAGVARAVEAINFLDVDRRRIELDVRFARFAKGNEIVKANADANVIGVGRVIVCNNEPAEVCVVADHHLLVAKLVARAVGERSVTVETTLTSQVIQSNGAAAWINVAPAQTDYHGFRRIVVQEPSQRQSNGSFVAHPVSDKSDNASSRFYFPDVTAFSVGAESTK